MAHSPAFQFYPADFLSDENTLVMSAEAIGAYWLLVCICWKQDGLPQEMKRLSQLARMQEKKFSRLWETSISACFYFDAETQRFRHRRLDKELIKQRDNSEKRKAAADARWAARQCKSNANALQNDALHISSSTSSANKKKKEDTPQAATPKRGTRLPEPFFLKTEMKEWAKEKRPTIDPVLETEKFCNYWRAKTGRDATKLDWLATWKNWILNARENGTNRQTDRPEKITNVERMQKYDGITDKYVSEKDLGHIA